MNKKESLNDMVDPKERNTDSAENEALTPDSENNILPDAESEEASPIAKLELELSAQQDKYLRLYSDFENYKKRMARDRIDQVRMAGMDFFLSILPVLDDFERALKSIRESSSADALEQGVLLVYNKLKSITEYKGLKAMESIGKAFDPELHEAITNVPATSPEMKGKVVEEVEKGYFLHDKVLRHAKVIVAQ